MYVSFSKYRELSLRTNSKVVIRNVSTYVAALESKNFSRDKEADRAQKSLESCSL